MLKPEVLKKFCRANAYREGEKLARGGKVVKPRRTVRPDGTEQLSALVEGSYGYVHRAQLLLSGEDEQTVLGYACGCYEGQNGWGMCRHCAAVGIQAAGPETSEAAPAPGRPARTTSRRLAGYMAHHRTAAVNLEEGIREGTVLLEPTLTLAEDGPGISGSVSFRIGVTRMYTVRNLVHFVHAVLAGEPASYGKGLSFLHSRSVFEERSRQVFGLLERAVRRRYPEVDRREADSVREQRQLELEGEELSALLRLYVGGQIRTSRGLCPVREQDPPLRVTVEGDGVSGAELRIPALTALDGAADTWVWAEDVFYHCSERFREEVLPFCHAVGAVNAGDGAVQEYLDESDYTLFGASVLPALEETASLEEHGVSLKDHRPERPRFRFWLSAAGEGELRLRPEVLYGEENFPLFAAGKEYRDLEAEIGVRERVLRYFDRTGEAEELSQTEEETIFLFLTEGTRELQEAGELLYEGEVPKVVKEPKATVGVKLKGNLLDLNVGMEEISPEEMSEILSACASGKRYYRLKNGEYLALEDGVLRIIRELSDGLEAGEDGRLHGELPAYRACYLDGLLDGGGAETEVRRGEDFAALVQRIRDYDDGDCAVPEALTATLRPYQETGYRWLYRLSECGLGGILADDMGLGKTLQVIALLARLEKSALVVCPASLLYNWGKELNRFAPSLTVRLVRGTASQRAALIGSEEAGILVTSYDLLRRDVELYRERSYGVLIVDEAQQLRNPATQLSRAVRQIQAEHRFALTGTPIENRLADLWSIFDFILPGYLYDYGTFRRRLEAPVVKGDEEALERLRRMVSPFILRRKKENVLAELPAKVEMVRYVEMTEEQRLLYLSQERAVRQLLESGWENRMKALAALTRLRQLCCAPQLYLKDYDGGAGKAEVCMELLENAAESGHRTLVFSQFTTVLEELARQAEGRGLTYLYLSGKDSKEQRQAMVERFQEDGCDVFFISLKAGGTGLTLTAADRVIHFDPWWNFAAEDQATDRAHRIGQENTLFVTRLVARDTIEERIVALQQSKRELSDSILENEALAEGRFDREELLRLLEPDGENSES